MASPTSDEYEDLVKAGVIDPTKVSRSALQNAASVASLLLTTMALIADKSVVAMSFCEPRSCIGRLSS